MQALVETLLPTSLAAMAFIAGHGLFALVRRRKTRRALDDYLTWLQAELEAL